MTEILLNIFLVVASLMALSVMLYVIFDMLGIRREPAASSEKSGKRTTKAWPTFFLAATLLTAFTALFNCAKKLVREWKGDKNPHDD